MPYLGAHLSAAGGLPRALERAREVGAECLQVFTRAPSRWTGRAIPAAEARQFRELRQEMGQLPAMAHDLYLTNLAAADPTIRQKSLDSVIEEIERCDLLGLDGLVLHMGAHEDEAAGLERLAEALSLILGRTGGARTPLWLETTAGQGTCLGHRFAHIGYCLRQNADHPRLGACLDSCHAYAAGYDLSTPEGYASTWEEFDREIGMRWLRALHLNDSQKPLGSRVDRHAHIGEGFIGEEGFARLVRDPRLTHLPMVIETPESETKNRTNLELLKGLRAASPKETNYALGSG